MIHKTQKSTLVLGEKCPVCNSDYRKRVQRKLWMRFIPGSKHYFCGDCNYMYISFCGSISYKMTSKGIETDSYRIINNHW